MDKALLIAQLRDRGALRTPALIRCFERIDRRDFVTEEEKGAAYGDYPLPIGFGQTISQPYTVAFMLELLGAKEGDRVLDIGSGSGWTTALLACVVGRQGSVIGLERIDELVRFGNRNLAKYDLPWAEIGEAGASLGVPGGGFDRILVSASASRFPQALIDQLLPGGVLVIPVGTSIFRVEKNRAGEVVYDEYPGFVFVPLI